MHERMSCTDWGVDVQALIPGQSLPLLITPQQGRAPLMANFAALSDLAGARLEQAGQHYRRYGHWSLLLSWLPIVGDPLTLVAGVMREPLARFLLIVTLAKGARYAVLAWATLGWQP